MANANKGTSGHRRLTRTKRSAAAAAVAGTSAPSSVAIPTPRDTHPRVATATSQLKGSLPASPAARSIVAVIADP